MSAAVDVRDPGPMARFEDVIERSDTMPIVVQRLSDGETLKQIAKAWQIPYGRFAQWIVEDRERSEQYNGALKVWADSLAQECVAIADEQSEVEKRDGTTFDPDVPRDKLRIETRMRLAGKWYRDRYGESQEVKHTGSVSLVAILSSMPRGNVVDVTPAPAALEAPQQVPQHPVQEADRTTSEGVI